MWRLASFDRKSRFSHQAHCVFISQTHENYFHLLLAHFLHLYKLQWEIRSPVTFDRIPPTWGGWDRSGVCPPPPTPRTWGGGTLMPPPWRDVRRPVISCETDRDTRPLACLLSRHHLFLCVSRYARAHRRGGGEGERGWRGFSFAVYVHPIPLLRSS
jgi:hypothetical protein